MRNHFRRLWREEEGQGMVEYGLILALISVVAITGLTAIGKKLWSNETTGGTGGSLYKKILQAISDNI